VGSGAEVEQGGDWRERVAGGGGFSASSVSPFVTLPTWAEAGPGPISAARGSGWGFGSTTFAGPARLANARLGGADLGLFATLCDAPRAGSALGQSATWSLADADSSGASAQPVASSAAVGTTGADSDADGIRPMKLTPTSAVGAASGGIMTTLDDSGGGSSGGESGGGSSGGNSSGGGSSGGTSAPPIVYVSGGGTGFSVVENKYYGVVGGTARVDVEPAPGFILETVTYNVGGAVYEQNYSWERGYQIYFQSGTITTQSPAGSFNASFSFCWDASVGNHSIDVNVTYIGGGSGSRSISVDVQKPNVESFTLDYKALELGSYPIEGGGSLYGIHLGDHNAATAGMKLRAVANTTNIRTDGSFSFIEMIQSNWKVDCPNDPFSPYTRITSGYVLDNPPRRDMNVAIVTMYGYEQTIAALSPSTQIPVSTQTGGYMIDAPQLGHVDGLFPWSSFEMEDDFEIYLVYQPAGGIRVALSKISFKVRGAVERVILPGPPETGALQFVPDLPPLPELPPPKPNQLPSAPGSTQGQNETKLLVWFDCFYPDTLDPGRPNLGTQWLDKNGTPRLAPVI
jgi:hypothetical protein